MLPTPMALWPLVAPGVDVRSCSVRDDIELGLLAYGFLGDALAALIELRKALFSEVHTRRFTTSACEIADRVDGGWLRQIASARVVIQADWKAALVDGESPRPCPTHLLVGK